MKRNKIIATTLTAALLITGASVFAEESTKKEQPAFRQKIELTEEQKAEMKEKAVEKAKEMLAKKLEEGKITQVQYDEQLAKIESGEFEFDKRMKCGTRQPMKNGKAENTRAEKAERKELTEEEKAERKAKMQEKAKEMLAKKLEEGKITQEQYDEQLAKIESGDFSFGNGRGNGFGKGRRLSHGRGGRQANTQDSNGEEMSK